LFINAPVIAGEISEGRGTSVGHAPGVLHQSVIFMVCLLRTIFVTWGIIRDNYDLP